MQQRGLPDTASLLSWAADHSASRLSNNLDSGSTDDLTLTSFPLPGSRYIWCHASCGLDSSVQQSRTPEHHPRLQGIYYDLIQDRLPCQLEQLLDLEALMSVFQTLPQGTIWRTVLANKRFVDLPRDWPYVIHDHLVR